jgi:hypothetical protein
VTRLAVVIVLGALGAGCLEVPSGPPAECHASSDCASGETCSEGLCYGNPPEGTFAATLSAPASRTDLVSTELATFDLPADGWLGELQLESPVTISGRVEAYCSAANTACSTTSIAAQIRLSRPSRFPGGPTVRFSTQSAPDVLRGTDSFTIRVPRTMDGDPPWTVTIDPDGGGEVPPADGGQEPAELIPPRHLSLVASDDLEHQTYILGSADAPVITGSLKDTLGQALLGYRVVALGRWDEGSSPTEVSTVSFSTNGTYSITVAPEAIGPLELVVTPFGATNIAPSLHVTYVSDTTHQRNITQPSGLGQPVMLDIPVQGLAGDGEVKMVPGVRVIVHASLDPMFSGAARVVFDAETTTGEDGIAHLSVLDGELLTGAYRIRMVPPANSNFGIVFDGPIKIGAPVPVRLPSRVALRGTVVDSTGVPQPAISVTARRSVRFLWSLPAEDQAFLDEIPASAAITPETGEFLVWVDPAVADVWGHYDLFFEAPAGIHVPSWAISDLEIPRMSGQFTVAIDTVVLPAAARVHGKIVDGSGRAVEGSAMRVFQLTSNELICREVGFEPQDCAPATLVLGSAESDEHGVVRVGLPRP